MKLSSSLVRKLVTGATVALVVVGTAGFAYAETSAGSSAASPSARTVVSTNPPSGTPSGSSAAPNTKAHKARTLLARAVHAQVIFKTKAGWKTVDIDKGTVNAISATSITITRPDGPQVSANITLITKFPGKPESQIQPGQKVRLVQSGGNALSVASPKGKPSAGTQPPTSGSTGASTSSFSAAA